METVVIDKYRIVPAPLTGIGWVAVEAWNVITGGYRHVATHRSMDEATSFISNQPKV